MPPAKKKPTQKRPAQKPKDDSELDSRPELSADAALDVIEADYEEDHSESPGWPETIEIELGEHTFEYRTNPAEDVLAYVQITLMLDSKNEDRLRSFIEAVMHPEDHAAFGNDVREHLRRQLAAGQKIDAKAFFDQITEGIIADFNRFMSPKDDNRSGGRRRIGRPSRSQR